jgi:nitroimidazol reductase NimA-like FMN-containing flavoprotein (pyridoxamine 5'-phosphate oxidase superfamily)
MFWHVPLARLREASVEETATQILDSQRIMAISTLRPDGWPQTTIVGYVNDGLAFYFLIFRSSQKFANICHDHRVSLAVGGEPKDVRDAKAVYAAARAFEVVEPKEREHAWRLLVQRHPNLADFDLPGSSQAALMRADCKYVSVLDYSKGFGHTEAFSTGDDSAQPGRTPHREEWGFSVASEI